MNSYLASLIADTRKIIKNAEEYYLKDKKEEMWGVLMMVVRDIVSCMYTVAVANGVKPAVAKYQLGIEFGEENVVVWG